MPESVHCPSALHMAWCGHKQIGLPLTCPFFPSRLSRPRCREAQCGQWEVSLSHLDCSACACVCVWCWPLHPSATLLAGLALWPSPQQQESSAESGVRGAALVTRWKRLHTVHACLLLSSQQPDGGGKRGQTRPHCSSSSRNAVQSPLLLSSPT